MTDLEIQRLKQELKREFLILLKSELGPISKKLDPIYKIYTETSSASIVFKGIFKVTIFLAAGLTAIKYLIMLIRGH